MDESLPPKFMYTVPEAARLLSLSRSQCYKLCAEGVIQTVVLGKSLRVPISALEALCHPEATR